MISLLSIAHNCYKRMILRCHRWEIDTRASWIQFGRSCASQLLKLTQATENWFQKLVTAATNFVNLPVAQYDTGQHQSLIHELHTLTNETSLCLVVRSLLENPRFDIKLNSQQGHWWPSTATGLSQGSVLAPIHRLTDQPLLLECELSCMPITSEISCTIIWCWQKFRCCPSHSLSPHITESHIWGLTLPKQVSLIHRRPKS